MTRTTNERFADAFDCDLFVLADKARAYGEQTGETDWLVAARKLDVLRTVIRKHMSERDREATKG